MNDVSQDRTGGWAVASSACRSAFGKRSTEAASSPIASKTISRSGFRRVGRLSWVSPEPVNVGREELQWLAKESGSFAGQWVVLEWVASGCPR